jgi:hypothetical protein
LAHRLKGADRAVWAGTLNGSEDVKITVTGDDLNKVIHAVTHGRKLDENLEAAPDFHLEFFKGSEHLTTVITSAGVFFWIDKTPYQDTTKTLEKLYEKAREEHPPMFSR